MIMNQRATFKLLRMSGDLHDNREALYELKSM